MTAVPFMIALATATLLFFVVANLRNTRDVLSAGTLLRFYLYIASFVTLVLFVAGVTYLLTGLISLKSIDFSYARPAFFPPVAATKDAPASNAADQQRFEQQNEEQQRDRQSTDLVRGGTLTVMGGLLFGLHAILRRRYAVEPAGEGNFARGYLVVGLVTFGLVGLVALPIGVYQAIKFLLVPPLATQARVAPGNTLTTGLVLTPLWVYYLLALIRQVRAAQPSS